MKTCRETGLEKHCPYNRVMNRDDRLRQSSWKAVLHLGFERRKEATVLAHCRHEGPLRVQKALYPEGRDLCQVIVLHPPSGIVGGDELFISVAAGEQSLVQMTTPGAGKLYGSAGPKATQSVNLSLGAGALLEWMPQETIVFDAARANLHTHVNLSADSTFFGWDIYCLGRLASGEVFNQGTVNVSYRLERVGEALWIERGRFLGNDPLLHSVVGLDGRTVCGTLMLSYNGIDASAKDLVALCRDITPDDDSLYGVTFLPGLLLVRYLGQSSEAVRDWFTKLWMLLRPEYLDRPAVPPRIWNT